MLPGGDLLHGRRLSGGEVGAPLIELEATEHVYKADKTDGGSPT